MGDTSTSLTNTTALTQQLQQVAFSNSNTKFPYLRKDEYEIWAMKMQNWIASVDFNLWNVILNGCRPKNQGKDSDGKETILEPVSAEEILVVQRENKARTILLQAIPDDHMGYFHSLTDPREIWMSIKTRFGGNEESKRMRKSMLKQEFQEFRITEERGHPQRL